MFQLAENIVDFTDTQDDRQFLLFARPNQVKCFPLALERVLEEKLDAAQRLGAGATRYFFLVFDIQKLVAQLFFGNLVGDLL